MAPLERHSRTKSRKKDTHTQLLASTQLFNSTVPAANRIQTTKTTQRKKHNAFLYLSHKNNEDTYIQEKSAEGKNTEFFLFLLLKQLNWIPPNNGRCRLCVFFSLWLHFSRRTLCIKALPSLPRSCKCFIILLTSNIFAFSIIFLIGPFKEHIKHFCSVDERQRLHSVFCMFSGWLSSRFSRCQLLYCTISFISGIDQQHQEKFWFLFFSFLLHSVYLSLACRLCCWARLFFSETIIMRIECKLYVLQEWERRYRPAIQIHK